MAKSQQKKRNQKLQKQEYTKNSNHTIIRTHETLSHKKRSEGVPKNAHPSCFNRTPRPPPLSQNRLHMNTRIYSSSFDDDFRIYTDSHQIPLSHTPLLLDQGLVMVCQNGWADIRVHDTQERLKRSGLLILLPGQLVSLKDQSNDFSADYFSFSLTLFDDVMSGLFRFSPDFFLYMRNCFLFPLEEKDQARFYDYFQMLRRRSASKRIYKRSQIIHLLRILFTDLYEDFYTRSLVSPPMPNRRKDELTHQFFQKILQSDSVNYPVSHYAEQLYISAKHLSTVIKQISGKSAKQWITDYTLLEIKSLIRNTHLEIQEIAVRTHFSNQSALCRFFRKHTGISPSIYRNLK